MVVAKLPPLLVLTYTYFYMQFQVDSKGAGPGVIKLFSCSTQMSTKFILLIDINMPTFISMVNWSHLRYLKQETSLFVSTSAFMSS